MAQVLNWSGVRHMRTRADERLELAARRQALAETCDLDEFFLDAFAEYYGWVTAEWAAVRNDRPAGQEIGASIFRSGDEADPNWLAYITGGARGFLKACHHTCVPAHEFATCAHYMCNVSYDGYRAAELQERVRRIALRASLGRNEYKQPITGLIGLGHARAAWWLTQARPKPPRQPDDQLSIEGTVLRLIVDADEAHGDAKRLRIHLLNKKQPADTPAFLRRDSKRAMQRARQRELEEPVSYAELMWDTTLLLPSRWRDEPGIVPLDYFLT